MLVLAVFLLAFSPEGSASEKGMGTVSPTFVRDSKTKVPRGGEVTVTLAAIPSYGNTETFEIMAHPLHGTLSNLKNTSDHTATVIYHHDGSKAPLQDLFSFRAKAPGQALSSPAKAIVRIIPPPPLLVFEPRELDFGRVILSGKRVTNVLLTNLGGERAVGRIVFPSGFSSTNGGGYSLAEGESAMVPVEFSPMEARVYEDKITCLPPVETQALVLRGNGVSRFAVTLAGTDAWNVRNLSSNAIRVSFLPTAGCAGWLMPPETVLTSASGKVFTFLQEDDDESRDTSSGASEGSKVRVSDGLTESILELPPARRFIPLTVQAITPSVMGTLPLGGSATLSFSLLNRSDLPKCAFWKVTSALGGGMQETSPLELGGGESKEIHYNWTPSLPGEGLVRLVVEEEKKTSHTLLWKALVSRSNDVAPASRIMSQKAVPAGDGGAAGEEAHAPPVNPSPALQSTVPAVDGVAVEAVKNRFGFPGVVARWNVPPGSISKTRIQECLLVPGEEAIATPGPLSRNSSSMMVKLQDLNQQSLGSDSARKGVLITGLGEGWHLIVISQTTAGGDLKAQSQVHVLVPRNPTLWGLVKMPLGILAMILLILFYRRLRRGE